MFTGIIQDIGTIKDIQKGGDWNILIATGLDLEATPVGASIACGGCCLTVTEKGRDWFSADVSAETLSKTTIGSWEIGTKINLEPSLHLGDELGGHFAFGHVDGVAKIISIEPDGDSHRLMIEAPKELSRYIAAKGSVSIDGISLTVNEVEGARFGLNIIPHTWEQTTLAHKQVGDQVNLEIDMLARYVARMMDERAAA